MGLELAKAFVTVRGDTSYLQRDLTKAKGPVVTSMGGMGAAAGRMFGQAMALAGVGGIGMMFMMAGREAVGFEKIMVDVRAITIISGILERAMIIFSVIPSAMFSCSGSPLILTKGRTAMEGLSGSWNAIFSTEAGSIGGGRR